MATNEQWIAQGKLLAAYNLLCDSIFGALAYLFGGDPGPESLGTLTVFLRPLDQALAALQLLDERSKNGDFSVGTFHFLRDSLKKAMDLATNDCRLPVAFELAQYIEKMPEDPTETDVDLAAGLWSCLTVTQEAAKSEVMALEYLQASTSLILALCRFRADENPSAAQQPDPSVGVGVS
jgi:hypothetical protein